MATNFLLKRSGTASKRPDGASMALGELDLNYDASTGGVFYKDSSGNVVKVGPAQVGATAPNASPAGSAGNSVGEFWYDTGATALKIWDGSTWVTTGGGGSGTVTSITAGSGLSGGTITTSGTISLDTACVVQPSAFTAKGSVLTATAASTPTALPVGTDGQVLTACSTCSTGLVWATPAAGGGVVSYGTFCAAPGGCIGNGTATYFPTVFTGAAYCCNLGWSSSSACNTVCFCCAGVYNVSLSGLMSNPAASGTTVLVACCNGTVFPLAGRYWTSPTTYTNVDNTFMISVSPGDCLAFTSTSGGCTTWSYAVGGAVVGPQLTISRVG